MVEYGYKIEEEVKAIQSEIRKIYREPKVMGRKLGLKSMIWNKRKKETFNWNRMKNQEIKKNEERLRNLQDNFKRSNIQIIGVPEGEEEEQEIENLFEKIMKENFSNLAKEIDIQVQETQRVPNKMDPKRNTQRYIIIKMPKIKKIKREL